MERRSLLYAVNMGMLISFILCALTGIVKWPGLIPKLGLTYQSLPFPEITLIHDWSGLVLCILAAIHLRIHWNWMIIMTKRMFLERRRSDE